MPCYKQKRVQIYDFLSKPPNISLNFYSDRPRAISNLVSETPMNRVIAINSPFACLFIVLQRCSVAVIKQGCEKAKVKLYIIFI